MAHGQRETRNSARQGEPPAERALRKLIRAFGLLERVMQPHFARFGISGAQWGVLRNLHRAEQEGLPSLRLTDLSRRMLIRPPSVTGIVDRLERSGLLVRRAAPDDLRAKQVALTERGRQLVGRVLAGHPARIAQVMGGLDAQQQEELDRLLGRLVEHLQTLADNAGDDLPTH
jgi:DNA-binding MarR family transcriptional regulator